jgi:hypothetical protein
MDTEDLDEFPKSGNFGLYIPCCFDCKKLAGSKNGDNLLDRAKYIHLKIQKKYEKYLQSPEWSDEELKEMSGKFAAEFRGFSRLSREVRIKTSWNYEKHIRQLDLENDPHDIAIQLGINSDDPPYWWNSIFPGY